MFLSSLQRRRGSAVGGDRPWGEQDRMVSEVGEGSRPGMRMGMGMGMGGEQGKTCVTHPFVVLHFQTLALDLWIATPRYPAYSSSCSSCCCCWLRLGEGRYGLFLRLLLRLFSLHCFCSRPRPRHLSLSLRFLLLLLMRYLRRNDPPRPLLPRIPRSLRPIPSVVRRWFFRFPLQIRFPRRDAPPRIRIVRGPERILRASSALIRAQVLRILPLLALANRLLQHLFYLLVHLVGRRWFAHWAGGHPFVQPPVEAVVQLVVQMLVAEGAAGSAID